MELVFSILAIIVSSISLWISVRGHLLDRSIVETSSVLYDGGRRPSVSIAIVNRGRRPVIIRMLGGNTDSGSWVAEHLESKDGGIRLGEGERYDQNFSTHEMSHCNEDGEVSMYKDLWIEDTLGVRTVIKDSEECIAGMYEIERKIREQSSNS